MAQSAEERWREFRGWVKSSVEREARFAIDELESHKLEKAQMRRDAFEDVWDMILAFERDDKS